MVTRLKERNKFAGDFTDQSVFGGNPSGPAACKIKPHWLWLAYSVERTAHRILHQIENAQGNFAVVSGPVLKIFPEL
jgi:hypothetical protein